MQRFCGYRVLNIGAFGAAMMLSSCFGGSQQNGAQPLPAPADLRETVDASPRYNVIYPFGGGFGGENPATQLAFDASGNAYGTTVQGGKDGCGTVFRLHRLPNGQWKETVLHAFTCFSDGKNPHGGVVRDAQGNLYGTTVAGGLSGGCAGDGCGVIFKVTPGGMLSTLYTFQGKGDGFGPGSPLALAADGNLYGTAPDGGRYGDGTVFQLKSESGSWHFGVIHQFTGGDDGSTGSLGSLYVNAQGVIFGVTELGGANQAGVAYRLNHISGTIWKFSTIYTFKGMPDGANPYGGLIETGGNLYGTTYYGGSSGNGSVFELTPKNGTYGERVVYSFTGASDGGSPTSTLFAASSGALYGTTSAGGRPGCGCGTVFSLAHGTFGETTLHRFGALHDGEYPYYGLTQSGSALYSSTVTGGTSGNGTIFSIIP